MNNEIIRDGGNVQSGKIGACVRISKDSMMEIFIAGDQSSSRKKVAIKDHPMFGDKYDLDSLKKAQPEILFLDFEKFDGKRFGSLFTNIKSVYWFLGIAILLIGILFNRYLMNFARQSSNW